MRAFVVLLLAWVLAGCNLSQSAEITPMPTPDLPRVEILAPSNNRQIVEGTDFDFDIVGADETQGIARIELYIDGEKVNEASPVEADAVPIFRVTMNWLAQGVGLHNVEVVAYRPDDTQSDPTRINLEVLPRE